MGRQRARTVRVDPELARMTVGLGRSAECRIWAVARHLDRTDSGSGKLSKRVLKTALSDYGIRYTRQHLNQILRAGEGVFWNSDRKHIYIRSRQHVARCLTDQALAESPDLLLNKPGVNEVFISPAGSLENWNAIIYAGWLAHRENPTISRAVLCKLFNRTPDTLRRWEEQSKHVTTRKNYAQCATVEAWNKVSPHTTMTYIARVPDGHEARFLWQLPNTYKVKGIKVHRHRGQSKKVRQAVNHQLAQPAKLWRGGSPVSKLYFDGAKKLRSYLKEHEGVCYLWRGENRHQHGIFEATDNGIAETTAKERVTFQYERHLLAEGQVRIRL